MDPKHLLLGTNYQWVGWLPGALVLFPMEFEVRQYQDMVTKWLDNWSARLNSGNGACGADFGRMLVGRASKSALRPNFEALPLKIRLTFCPDARFPARKHSSVTQSTCVLRCVSCRTCCQRFRAKFGRTSERTSTPDWVPEGSLAGICWVGFWGLGGPWWRPRTGYLKAVWPEFVGSVFGVWAAPGGDPGLGT